MAFIVFECLETPVKHEARVFEMASQSAPNCKQKKKRKQNHISMWFFAFFCLISAQFVMIMSVFFTIEACLFQVVTICIQWVLLVPKHGRVSWGWILPVSTAQKCAKRRFFACTCKQQTIKVIKLCSCVLLFLIDFQTHVFGYPNTPVWTSKHAAVSKCIHVTLMRARNWFITSWIINEFENDQEHPKTEKEGPPTFLKCLPRLEMQCFSDNPLESLHSISMFNI